jgi:hypothetical protein
LETDAPIQPSVKKISTSRGAYFTFGRSSGTAPQHNKKKNILLTPANLNHSDTAPRTTPHCHQNLHNHLLQPRLAAASPPSGGIAYSCCTSQTSPRPCSFTLPCGPFLCNACTFSPAGHSISEFLICGGGVFFWRCNTSGGAEDYEVQKCFALGLALLHNTWVTLVFGWVEVFVDFFCVRTLKCLDSGYKNVRFTPSSISRWELEDPLKRTDPCPSNPNAPLDLSYRVDIGHSILHKPVHCSVFG